MSRINDEVVLDEGRLWDMDVYSSNLNVNSSVLNQVADDVFDAWEEQYREVNFGETRRNGQMPKDNWMKLAREHKKAWMAFPHDVREDILTSLLAGSPPSKSEEHRIPGTGVSSRNARATNSAVSDPHVITDDVNTNERSVNMGYIQAMRSMANTNLQDTSQRDNQRTSMDPFVPARLMSKQNKSSKELIPIKRGQPSSQRNASMASALQEVEFPDLLPGPPCANRNVNMTFIVKISDQKGSINWGETEFSYGLVDGGANIGLGNSEHMRRLWYVYPPRCVKVKGIGQDESKELQIATFAARVKTKEDRSVILIFHEYAEMDDGPVVHSKIQMTFGNCQVGDLPHKMGGTQCIDTFSREDNSTIPLTFNEGLPFIRMSRPTEDDLRDLPWIEMTQSVPWNPNVYDGDCLPIVNKFRPNVDSENRVKIPFAESVKGIGWTNYVFMSGKDKRDKIEVKRRVETHRTDTVHMDSDGYG